MTKNTTRSLRRATALNPRLSLQQSWPARLRAHGETLAQERPARLALIVLAGIVSAFTLLLLLPGTTRGPHPSFVDALFTATSAISVTGLAVVDTATYWSGFGHVILMFGMMIGGIGVMTLASIMSTAISRHIGLTRRILTASETQTTLGNVGSLIRAVIVVALTSQAVLFVLMLPFFLQQSEALLPALWHSLFMAVSIFNNGGLVIIPGGLSQFAGSWLLSLPVILGTISGAIGFPVLLDVWRERSAPRKWSVTTKITLVTYLALFVVGAAALAACEWQNPATIGHSSAFESASSSTLVSSAARSSGLSTIDVGSMTQTSWFVLDTLMFIGGGSASAAGGIKVTTFAVLILAVIAEARGDRDTQAFGKRFPPETLRLAVAATLLGAFIVGVGVIALLQVTSFGLSQVLFEAISAFATCGLSTGITASVGVVGKYVLVALMFCGRVGTMTLAAALALRTRKRVIRYPEETPIIG
ncbi:MAG: potassium transporter TrkG [Actinomycetaceae bacterium]|nr:potassium transporter TrkG [Actinomycetaceae bacterium]MDY6082675.1 potassium transporter TrkG [Actinomycetaceae bacterium]